MLRVVTIFYYGFRREDLELIIGPCELTSDMLKKQALERVKFSYVFHLFPVILHTVS
jgi:hypothetical protein